MKRPLWLLVPVALVGGVAVGLAVRHSQTKTVTVVQIQTQAPPPPSSRKLTVHIYGANGACLSGDTSSKAAQLSSDTYDLRRLGNGLTDGEVVGVSDQQAMSTDRCSVVLTFGVSPDLGFFQVSDETQGVHWGPFDSHGLSARGYALQLNFTD